MFTEQLPALRTDIEQLISNLATKLHEGGLVSSTYADKSWTERLLALQTETDAAIQLIKGGILPPAFRTLYEDPRILDVAAQLGVGKDCAVSPAWNIRAKMPSHDETVVAWHCDNSYWEPRIWGDHVITCWVALVDVDMSNGALLALARCNTRRVWNILCPDVCVSPSSLIYITPSASSVAPPMHMQDVCSSSGKHTSAA